VVFAQQPVVRIEDQYGNLRNGDNSTLVTSARNAGTGALQGKTTLTASGGVASFSDLSYPVAETMTIQFSSSGLTGSTSTSVLVNTGPFTKLLVLAPGETAVPGSANGKSGTPSIQSPDTAFNLTISAVDDNWNLINSVTDILALASSDLQASIPTNVALVAGTKQISVVLSTPGTNTISIADLSDASKIPATSSGIPIVARFASATGGSAISADTTGGAFTSLTGPTYSENASGDAGVGTIVLNAPAGFVFDIGGTPPTVRIDRISGNGIDAKNINSVASGTVLALTSVSSTQLVFTITSASASGNFCKLTWQNIRVRPTAGTPLAFNKLTRTGTSALAGVTNSVSNFGTLREVTGLPNRLVLETQPSITATAGGVFPQQPIIQVRDQFGNLCSAANGNSDNGRTITAIRLAGAGLLQGQTDIIVFDGRALFTNLYHTVATNITIGFSSGALAGTTSAVVTINPAQATQLFFAGQPTNSTVGTQLLPPPLVCTCDAFGNKSAVGLASSVPVTIWLSAGAGSLLGTTTSDIGLSAGNGLVSFSNLSFDSSGTKQLSVSASGLTNAVSTTFTVAKSDQTINFGALPNKVYGDAPFALHATASSGLPVSFILVGGPATLSGNTLSITGTGTVTVRALQPGDSNWNAAAPMDQSFVVARSDQTITFVAIADRTYGDAPFHFTATASSGLPVSFTLLSGPANVSGDLLTITGSGMVSVRAQQAGDSNWNSANPVDQSFLVAKAVVTVTADNQTRVYGAPNPTFTATYNGFVNGDDASAISGAPQVSTSATIASSVSGSPYPIVLAQGSLNAANYSFAFVNGTLSISQASSSVVVASSANPACTGSNVTFTATVAPVAPGSGNPNGTVQFRVDGSALGAAAGLTNGMASLTSSSLSHGTHQITAEYCGDQNFLPSTNALNATQIVNLAPAALPAFYQRQFGASLPISIQDLLTNFTSDADGDVISLVSVGPGTNGATISINGSTINYQPSATDPNRNTTDYLDYTITDGFIGGMATNKIQISLTGPDPASQPPVISRILLATNSAVLTFTGIAGYTYHIERSASISSAGSVWVDIGTVTTDGGGNAQFVDSNPISGKGFYHIVWKK
jgi:hypothetical protein